MKALFLAISQKLKANPVLGLSHIDLFANQLAEPQKQVIFYPAVFIQFNETEFEDLGQGVQMGDMLLTIHIASDITGLNTYEGSENQGEALGIFDLKDLVQQTLQGFAGDFFSSLTRVRERQDENYSNIYVFQITYQTQIRDNSTWLGNEQLEVNPDLSIQKELAIQNLKWRT